MVEEEGMSVEAWARAWHEMPLSIVADAACACAAPIGKTRLEIGEWRTIEVAAFASRSHNCPYDGFESNCWPAKEGGCA